ncbi:transcriptional regulator [Myxococcus sp. MISCRS1]|jgi:DNA-binding transcriptional regulator GbsR (MarR family)|uniref:GbsR/MarR family transcriptional regulator n=1 Tax=Myxococcus TaxID=32 RepID=UPI001CBCC89C|nr:MULTISPECIES: transcriptional regulator [unclassified Myxococcus]MBZ4397056.1 transcriptional regulator [Myxococcus sp. AS-1-15]MBZ4408217.1 transcriptional regulator [Myxococcus sp. XM-1-1-1]MCY0996669.1 transcriptional regulator [Myxococcus sp. MISCRS1]BDT33314.1 transcriptional regulator [Myxococcus sp. MH1]
MKELGVAEQRFIESMGLYFERQGGTRIGGRIHALLMLTDEPLSLQQLARVLKVSAASVSTNIRASMAIGLVEPVSVPGDRQHYYVVNSNGWESRLRTAEDSVKAFVRVCQEALSVPQLANKHHLREAADFCDFYLAEMAGIAERWRASRAARPTPRTSKASKGRTA